MTQEFIGEKTPSMANKRPATMSELRKCIMHGLYDNSQPFRFTLKRAEQSRREGKQYSDTDLERAFVAFARAGYLVLVKLPMHPHYKLLLSDEQRRNMLHVGYFNLFFDSSIDNIQAWSGYPTNTDCLEAKDRRPPNRMGYHGCVPRISRSRYFPSTISVAHKGRHYTACAGCFQRKNGLSNRVRAASWGKSGGYHSEITAQEYFFIHDVFCSIIFSSSIP